MKKGLIKLVALSTAFVVGLGLSINHFEKPVKVEAAQYIDDYDPYTYSGNYYDSIDFDASEGMNGTLRTSLTSLIKPKGFYTYSSSGTNHLSTQLQYADEDPTNSNNMVYLYTRDSVAKNPATSWNREHVWPQSLSNGNWGESGGGTDVLHIRPTYNKTNEVRGNDLYGDNGKLNPLYYNSMLYGYSGSGSYFEPLDEVKGDVARIIMYVWVTYTGYSNYNPLNILAVFQSYNTLLKWHTMDRPDMLEGNRNDYSQTSVQKNRNPFVDHPELAWKIFGDNASANIKQECMEAYPADGSSSGQKQLVSIQLSGQPTKKDYYVGESFNPSGLTVTAFYNDNSSKQVAVNSCTWLPDPLTEGTTSVTCKYGSCTAIYSGITVSQRETAGGEYGVEFTQTSDSGTDITNSNITAYYKSNTLVKSVTNCTKVFPGTYGLKLGSSSTNGSITFNFVDDAQANIVKVSIQTNAYNGNGSYSAKLGNTTLSDGITAGTTYSKDLAKTTATSLTINSNGRMYIMKIIVEIAVETPPTSSSEPPVSSSEISSSPIEQSSSQEMSSPIEQSSSIEESCIDQTSSSAQEESSIPEPTTSEEPIIESSEPQPSSSEEQAPNKKRGCFGSITGTVTILSITSLLGLVFVFSKKK